MRYRTVSVLLGVLLLVAGYLKLEVALVGVSSWANVLRLHALLPVAEILFGSWLISGTRAVSSRYVALACFALFGCVSLYHLVRLDSSCGCFGRIAVAPWITLTIDVMGFYALLASSPSGDRVRWCGLRYGLLVACSFAVIGTAWWAAENNPADDRLHLDPSVVDLGSVERGGMAFGKAVLTNRTAEPIEISSFTTSCPCVTVAPQSLILKPGESADLAFVMDLSDKPGSHGRLRIDVWPRTGPAQKTWSIPVLAQVD